MKRYLAVLFAVALFWLLCPYAVGAEQVQDTDTTEQIQEFYESSGANELFDQLPSDTEKHLNENGIDSIDSDKLVNMDMSTFFGTIWDGIVNQLTKPLRVFLMVIGVVLLAALLNAFKSSFEDKGYVKVFSIVSVLCVSGVLITPIVDIIKDTVETLKQVSEFILGFIPVYAGIITVSGKPVSAFTYNSLLVGSVEVVSAVATYLLIPLVGIYLAFCLVGAATDTVNINGLAKTVKSVVVWSLGFLLTIFVGILTIKSFVANATDSVTLRTGKYLAGSFIPVVGGAISDAFSVVQGCMGVIKSTVGAFGILAILLSFLPGIISILLMLLSIKVAQGVSDILEVPKVSSLLDATSFVLSLMLSIMICFAVMLIISISLMLVLGVGT